MKKKKYIVEDKELYQTKYPILLVHGMMLKDFKFYRAFRKIKDVLIDNNLKVYISQIDGVGSIKTNALQLKEEVEEILKKENVDKINIIAHSKGGLDSRYMIFNYKMDNKVASLTTLSTPHHGSKVSKTILKMPKFMARFLAFWINLFYKIFKDKHPDILTLANELTDTYMEDFNNIVIKSNKVYYQSYSSDITKSKSFITYIPKKITMEIEDDATDGIVSVESAKFGDYQGNMPSDFDHINMVGFYGSKKKLLEVAKFYLLIVKGLKAKGF